MKDLTERINKLWYQYASAVDLYHKEAEQNKKAIQRVRELHSPWTHTFPTGVEVTYCRCNAEMYEYENEPPYPCPTIKALDGDQDA